MLIPSVSPFAFKPRGVHFDGVNDYLSRGADFTGLADGDLGTLSFWMNPAAEVTGGAGILHAHTGAANRFRAKITNVSGNNRIDIEAWDSGGTSRLDLRTSQFIDYSNSWYHVVASWDVQNGLRHLYVDDISDAATSTSSSTNTLDYTAGNWWVGSENSGSSKFDGDLAEIWFNTSYLDLSVTANRRKFITANGKPAYLGKNGTKPTGSIPLLYLSGKAAAFATNKGSGGGMTVTGSLTDAATRPQL